MRTLLTNLWQSILLKKIPFTIAKIGHILHLNFPVVLGYKLICENFIGHHNAAILWRGVIPPFKQDFHLFN